MDSPDRIFGIDLGTTYSCIAYVDEYGKPVVIAGENNRLVTSSVVFFETESNVVVGDDAKEFALVSEEQTVQFIKQYMGDPTWSSEFFRKTYRPEDISALILRKLATFAEAETGYSAKDVVITTPAYFNSAERTATEQAGQLAGLNVRAIIPEPTAAAIAYSASIQDDQTVLVYDLGGGTFDVAVIDIKEERISVVCTDGDHSLGGRLWDDAVVGYFAVEWQSQTESHEDPLDDLETGQHFRNEAEKAKRILSNRETAPVTLNHKGVSARVQLTRTKFDELTAHLLGRSIDLTRKVLARAAEKERGDISKILLVGGSCYMPQVQQALMTEFGLTTELADPDQAVAKGAAAYAANKRIQELYMDTIRALFPGAAEDASDLTEEQKDQAAIETANNLPEHTLDAVIQARDREIVNVCSKNFGVIALDDRLQEQVVYMIKKDSEVPAEKEQQFGLAQDNQETVLIRIVESSGDDLPDTEPTPLPSHAKEIGSAILEVPPGLRRQSPILISYFLSEDGGRLRVVAKELTQGGEVKTEVSEVNALTEAEIEERQEATAITVT